MPTTRSCTCKIFYIRATILSYLYDGTVAIFYNFKLYFILSFSLSHYLPSLLSLNFVLQLLSPLLKPKTPFFSNPKLRVVVVAAEVGVGIGVSAWVL